MTIKTISIQTNKTQKSEEIKNQLELLLNNSHLKIDNKHPDCVIAIGGDGSFLHAVQEYHFLKDILFLGIHTGNLGFLQEIEGNFLEKAFQKIEKNDFRIEKISILKAIITSHEKQETIYGLNEFSIRESNLKTIYLDIEIEQNFLETLVGDGVCVSTSTGSTAYNLSLGGSIIYPGLPCFQLIPIAPIHSTIHNSLKHGIVIPEKNIISIKPNKNFNNNLTIVVDGIKKEYQEKIEKIEITTKEHGIQCIRFDRYNFWNRINEKIL